MDVYKQSLFISAAILLFSLLPFWLDRVSKSFQDTFFLVAAGSMAGLCAFHLVPHFSEAGDVWVWALLVGVFLIYSLSHLGHVGHDHGKKHGHSFYVFIASLSVHNFASGVFLDASAQLSGAMQSAAFWMLVGHKAFESIMMSTLLRQQDGPALTRTLFFLFYASSFGFGAWISSRYHEWMHGVFAWRIAAAATGTLLGCVIFDFMIPAWRKVKSSRFHSASFAVGVLLSLLFSLLHHD